MSPASFRTPAPNGLRASDGAPLLVLPHGTRLQGRYRVEFLEPGGMSVTYRGFDGSRPYLIKEVSSLDPERVIALNQEKCLLERLDHPGIVKVHDLFEEDGHYYLVLEYIEGPRLDRLVSPLLQEEVVVDWAVQLCDIFDYLHQQRPPVIYRDLKPKNVIKTPEGRIRLIDFGTARVHKQGKARDTSPMGTALTASPEHYGGKQTDARSDIYTLGATLHFLLTNGRNPAPEPFAFTPVRDIRPELTPAIEGVVQKAVEVHPEDRFQSAQELKQALMSLRAPADGRSELLLPAREAAAANWASILVLEDDRALRVALVEALSDQRYQVKGAASGQEALMVALHHPFELLVADIRMAGMDGLETLARLREYQPYLKAIIITGYACSEAPSRAIRQMASDYLYKPFRVHDLLQSVAQVLKSDREATRNLGLLETFSKGFRRLKKALNQSTLTQLHRQRGEAFQAFYVGIRSRRLGDRQARHVWELLYDLEEKLERFKSPKNESPGADALRDGYRYVLDLVSALDQDGVKLRPNPRSGSIGDRAFSRLYRRIQLGELTLQAIAMAPFLSTLDRLALTQSDELARLHERIWGGHPVRQT